MFRRSASIALFAVIILMLLPQSSGALGAWMVNRNPSGFINMTAGASMPTSITAFTDASESTQDFYVQHVIGSSIFASDIATIEPGSQVTAHISIPFTAAVMNSCIGDSITVNLQIIRVLPGGGEEIAWDEGQIAWPCSISDASPTIVSVIPPVWTAVCGSNNDTVDTSGQPDGVLLSTDSTWIDGTRTMTFSATENHFLEGQSEFTFADTNDPCLIESPVEPVQSAVCGPNNDDLALPEQPEGVLLVSAPDWSDNARTIVYGPAEGSVFEGQGEFTFTDANVPCPMEPTPETPTPPTSVPTIVPTVEPTGTPTMEPSPAPSPEATVVPTTEPTAAPTAAAVTSLPETGSGSSSESTYLGLSIVVLIGIALGVRRRLMHS